MVLTSLIWWSLCIQSQIELEPQDFRTCTETFRAKSCRWKCIFNVTLEVCALYPPVKEKVHCSAPNSVKNLVMHRIRWQIQHWFFHSAEKSIFFNDYFITEFGDDLLATNSSLNPVMKISLFSFVIFWVTEFSAYVCTEVDENDFGQDFSTEFSEKLCASLNSMTN